MVRCTMVRIPRGGKATRNGCWQGKGDASPFVAGLPETVPRARSLPELFAAMACCTRCDLAPERTRVVHGVGSPDAEVLLVGEAPGAQEDRQGEPFVGRAGKLLDRLLQGAGLRRDEVFITNVVACRPPANRNPRVREVRAHAPWLEEQIRLVAPVVIVTLGRIALTYFLPGGKITELRGVPQRLERVGGEIWLLPLYHPAAALRRRELIPEMEADFARLREIRP